MVLLHANALRTEELETQVLPLFEKHRVAHDMFTYQHIIELYNNLREHDMVVKLYERMKKEGLGVNKMILSKVLETAMRTENTDLVVESLERFIDIKQEPDDYYLVKLSRLKEMPDRLYFLIKDNFKSFGLMLKPVRKFPQPTFNENTIPGSKKASIKSGKRIRMKKKGSTKMSKQMNREVNVV